VIRVDGIKPTKEEEEKLKDKCLSLIDVLDQLHRKRAKIQKIQPGTDAGRLANEIQVTEDMSQRVCVPRLGDELRPPEHGRPSRDDRR
jgi:hypothetical protein